MRRVVIAGGGIAGLSTARALVARDPRLDIVVLEGAHRAGGNIRTEDIDGYRCESGPDGFLDNAPATLALVQDIGLESHLLPSQDAARHRFIFRDGSLHEVPTSPGGCVRTRLLSARGKARLALEPLARTRRDDDESIYDFAARRIGPEAATVLVDSFVSGVFAGDAHALSLRACFPRMRELEDKHGGLVRALLATRRQRKAGDVAGAPAGRLTSFVGGMTELIGGLVRALDGVVRTDAPVAQLRKSREPELSVRGVARSGFMVTTPSGTMAADAVVLAGPAAEAARLVHGFDSELAGLLADIPSAPLAVVCLGFDETAIRERGPLAGFGFLVPRNQDIRILGCLWETSIYAHRAPAGKVLLRVMIGGARDPHAVALEDDELLAVVRRELAATMGVTASPVFVHIVRHRRGIPQYVQGHLARLERIDARLASHPGLHLAGNSYRSPSINACIAEAGPIADAVIAQLAAAQHERESLMVS
jgi:oxygen-dependent protoporphyrinogen oxidase